MCALLRSLPVLILLALLAGCDSGSGPDDDPSSGDLRTDGEYTATIQYTADGSQDAGEPTAGTGSIRFRVTSATADGAFTATGSSSLSLGTHHSNIPNLPVTGTVSGSTLTFTASSGVNLSATGAATLSSNGETLTVASARLIASAFVGLETGTTTSLVFTFRSDF